MPPPRNPPPRDSAMKDNRRHDCEDRSDRVRPGRLQENHRRSHSPLYSRRPLERGRNRLLDPGDRATTYPHRLPQTSSRQSDYPSRRSTHPDDRGDYPLQEQDRHAEPRREAKHRTSGEIRGSSHIRSPRRRSRSSDRRRFTHPRVQSPRRQEQNFTGRRSDREGKQEGLLENDGKWSEEARRPGSGSFGRNRGRVDSFGRAESPSTAFGHGQPRPGTGLPHFSVTAPRQTRSRSPSRSHPSGYRDRSPHEAVKRFSGSGDSRSARAIQTRSTPYSAPRSHSRFRNLPTATSNADLHSPSDSKPHHKSTRPESYSTSSRSHDEGGRRRPRGGDEDSIPPLGEVPPATTGADADEAKMSSRGGYRGSYHSHMHPSNRNYSQSPQTGSYHGSPPPPQSPYAGRGGWGGQPQYSQSMQQQYPRNGYGPSQGHYPSSSHNSSSYSQSGGPAQHYPPNYRGGYRGGGGFRGNHRGGNRDFKTSQWGVVNQGPGSRARPQHDDVQSQQGSQQGDDESHPSRAVSEMELDDVLDGPLDDDAPFVRPTRHDVVAEPTVEDKDMSDAMPPPPTKPLSDTDASGNGSKFSFAFNKSLKPTTVTPSAEISQKFNAPPRGRQPFTAESRERDAKQTPPPTRPSANRSRREQKITEPRESVKADPPKVRMIKKIVQSKKPRPKVDPELARSPSVYYRKPGDGSVVGSGTYGKVFKGLHVYTKKYVALKRIRMEGEKDGFPVTAIREVKLLQSLKHENVVALLEVMVERNDCFMVFEYLSHDLTGILNHPTFKLNDAQRKHMAMQLFAGLDYLHGRGVLHRDIKAANILVSNDGVLKLADFGLARFYDEKTHYDYTNRVVTIWYRSPELLLGETTYAASVDVWSAACVLIEIFTGSAIFPGDGTEVHQISLIYDLLGSPSISEWPEIKDLPWIQLLKPKKRQKSAFLNKYGDKLTSEAFHLLSAMFRYNPVKRPLPSEILQHPYFTTEEPAPRQAVELGQVEGEWHELESKALRKKQLREAREAKESLEKARETERKRPHDGVDAAQPDRKRIQSDGRPRGHEREKRHGLDGASDPRMGQHGERPPSAKPAPLAQGMTCLS